MKTLITGFILLASLNSFASDKLCYDVSLSYNTHPNHPCPDLRQLCLESIQGKMNLQVGEVTTSLNFSGHYVMNQSDVGQEVLDFYTSKDLDLNIYYQTDGNWPATVTGGFDSLSVSTGVVEPSGVNYSQSCSYKLK